MSLSSTGTEVQTAVVQTDVTGGSTSTEQIDADEDRKIHGYSLAIDADQTGTASQAFLAEAFVGVDPGISTGAEDLGGKFYARATMSRDGSNGYSLNDPDELLDIDSVAWDWNEDVTLTLTVSEENGSSGGRAVLEVYYTEA